MSYGVGEGGGLSSREGDSDQNNITYLLKYQLLYYSVTGILDFFTDQLHTTVVTLTVKFEVARYVALSYNSYTE
jgi:hypothetical protein